MRRALTLLLLRGPEVNAGKFPLSQVFFDEKGGGIPKSHMEPSPDCLEDGPEPGCFAP